MSEIHTQVIHDDVPQFERIYTAKLDQRCSIKVSIKIFLNDWFSSAELIQPNGRWIIFDVKAIADKIIDPILVPLVEKAVDEILEMDKQYRKTECDEFTDKKGQKWEKI